MAEFLQDTIEEISVFSAEKGKKPNEKLNEFQNFVEKTRTEGNPPSNGEIMKYSKLFEDDLTLESLTPGQLKALCRIMEIATIGPGYFLIFRIRKMLDTLKADDQMIRSEGIDSLSTEELQNACSARGMRSLGISVDRMKLNLKQWLELSLDQEIPASLLLLSRTFYMQEERVDEQLKLAISQLPERLIDEMELKIGAAEGESVDRQTHIDIIKHEEEEIKNEKLRKEKEKAELLDSAVSKELHLVKEMLSISDKEKLDEIKEEREEYIDDVRELKEVKKDAVESVASVRLGKKMDAILVKVDVALTQLEKKESDMPTGKIDEDEDGIVTTTELFNALKKLNAPNETRIQNLIEIMDEDSDGVIDLNEIRSTIQLLVSEHFEMSELQITEALSLLRDVERTLYKQQLIDKKKNNYLVKLIPTISRKSSEDIK